MSDVGTLSAHAAHSHRLSGQSQQVHQQPTPGEPVSEATPDSEAGLVLAAVCAGILDGVVTFGPDRLIKSASPIFADMVAMRESDLVQKPIGRFVHLPVPLDTRWPPVPIGRTLAIEGAIVRPDGRAIAVKISLTTVKSLNTELCVALIRDLAGHHAAEHHAHTARMRDHLTGLPDRLGFLSAVSEQVSNTPERWGVVCLDIDGFRDINEVYGTHSGDVVLRSVAMRIEREAPAGAILGRVSDDEFAVAIFGSNETEAEGILAALAARLAESCRAELTIESHMVRVSCSLGTAIVDASIKRPEELISKAQIALNRARQRGGGRYEVYTPALAAHASRRMQLKLHLAQAALRGELSLMYQPIVDRHGRISSAEALLRWNHTVLGPVSPAEFIPIAEESGLIVPLTNWVLKQVAQDIRTWLDQGICPDRIYMNVSSQSLMADTLIDQASELVTEFPELADRLGIEITEQAAVGDFDAAVRMVRRLANLGLRTAVDDFGTGYSSLSYLQRLPVQALKIDRSFIEGLPHDERNAALVKASIGLAKGLGLDVVAEGVETEAQFRFLASIGCDRMQGFLFSTPQTLASLTDTLTQGDIIVEAVA